MQDPETGPGRPPPASPAHAAMPRLLIKRFRLSTSFNMFLSPQAAGRRRVPRVTSEAQHAWPHFTSASASASARLLSRAPGPGECARWPSAPPTPGPAAL